MESAQFAELITDAQQSPDSQWHGRCPAHDDQHPSLTWADGTKGLVVTCHKGCSVEQIAMALGLRLADFFHAHGTKQNISAIYDYKDESGTVLYQVVRCSDKTFRQRRPRVGGGYIWNVKGVRRVLYRLPEIMGKAIVVVVEGEKDVDTLLSLGIPATTNSGGAGKWTDDHAAQLKAAGGEKAVILPDNDEPGEQHAEAVARSCRAAGLGTWIVRLPGLPPKGDVTDWIDQGYTRDELIKAISAASDREDLGGEGPVAEQPHQEAQPRNLWMAAQPISAFLNQEDVETQWLDKPLIAPGAVTEVFSPRGLGKTHVAYAKAVTLALQGKRVLLLDRDNPPREVKRRLRAWGAGQVSSLNVMTRGQVPSLTDAAAWANFPVTDYDLVIIDSLDSTAEGIGEKDSAKPSKALKPILDLARRVNGPAVLILGNTVRSGQHSRGSGVIEDRADIVFEVRDATNFQPTGTKEWWLELPPADAGAWGSRTSRRKQRDTYRLAVVPTKFRLGEEPDPFVVEIDMMTEPWRLRDVTQEIAETGKTVRLEAEEAHKTRLAKAESALTDEIRRRAAAGEAPVIKGDAEAFLTNCGLKRQEARTLVERGTPSLWRLRKMTARRGEPVVLLPASEQTERSSDLDQSDDVAAETTQSKTPRKQILEFPTIFADRMNTDRRKPRSRRPAPDATFRKTALFSRSGSDTSEIAPHLSESAQATTAPGDGLEVVDL